jgi:hypothetical protein
MFIRKRTRRHRAVMGVAGVIVHCKVLDRERVAGKPRQRLVAAWTNAPSLSLAIADAEARVQWEARHLARAQRLEKMAQKIEVQREELAHRQGELEALQRASRCWATGRTPQRRRSTSLWSGPTSSTRACGGS